jgi:hypothetical protein
LGQPGFYWIKALGRNMFQLTWSHHQRYSLQILNHWVVILIWINTLQVTQKMTDSPRHRPLAVVNCELNAWQEMACVGVCEQETGANWRIHSWWEPFCLEIHRPLKLSSELHAILLYSFSLILSHICREMDNRTPCMTQNVFTHVTWLSLQRKWYTRCNNWIPGIALWKQNLLTCALAAAVAFEILSLWSYALRETMVPLPEIVLKIVFRNTSH